MGVAPPIKIREASPRDALGLVNLRREVVAEERWFIGHPGEMELSLEQATRQITTLRGREDGLLLVARQTDQVVGYLSLLSPPFRRTWHVVKLEIAVAEQARGQGIGRALMEAGIEWARRAKGIEKIGLSVFADNERALAMYERLGFQTEGRRLREYKDVDGSYRDDVLLSLLTD